MNYLVERRQEEKERRRGDILDAAEAVAATEGLEAMTMDQVARKARLSRALLYVYFQDKSDLLFGICSRGLDVLHQRFEAAVARHPTGLDQARACGRAYVAFAHEFPTHFDALARFEAHAPQAEVAPDPNEGACILAGDRVHAVLIRAIENGVRDGSIRADVGPAPLVSATLWGFTHGIIQLVSTKGNVLAQNGISTTALVEHALETMTRSLARLP